MKLAIVVLIFVVSAIFLFLGYYTFIQKRSEIAENKADVMNFKTLTKYTIENLSKVKFEPSKISLGEVLKEDDQFISRVFYFSVQGKKVSGQINYPKKSGVYPVIVMNRGYIEREGFKTGDGTRRSSEEFAKAGFVTLAPDFLGYGASDNPSENVMEERFQTYITSATLMASLVSLNSAFANTGVAASIDPAKVGLWGHSNGGQITITVLEITGKDYPTVLWAPVTKPFPYSILYYTDDIEDHGKALRKVVAEFEKDYESEQYSLTNYLDKINAPIEVYQGTADEAVPISWTNDFVKNLKDKYKDVSYFTFAGDDHNFAKGSWNTVVARNIGFFKNHLQSS